MACVVRACGVTFRTPRAEFPRRRSPGHCVAPAPAGGAGQVGGQSPLDEQDASAARPLISSLSASVPPHHQLGFHTAAHTPTPAPAG